MDDRTLAELGKLLGQASPRRVYEIGSRNVNGSARSLLRSPERYYGIDLVAGRDVDVVADGLTHEPPFVPDCVVCCEVLEHTSHAEQLVKRMVEVVAPGGLVLISCAGPEREPHSIEGGPLGAHEFYRGVEPADLSRWLVEAGTVDGQLVAALWTKHGQGAAGDVYAIARKPVPLGSASHARVPGVAPGTVVETPQVISFEDLAQRVQQTCDEHGALLQAYHDVWYNCGHTWVYTHFLGVSVMKNPNDLWIYQALLTTHRPRVVIETGTYQGGSALWFACLMDGLGIEGGRVYTIDFEDHIKPGQQRHPRITFLAGDSTDAELAASIAEDKPAGPLLISLDADHTAEHVEKELEIYAPLCAVGDWLVVEDTDIAWDDQAGPNGERVKGDRGARGGLQAYIDRHPGEWRQDLLCERYLNTCHPGGWLQRMKACEHDR